MDRRVWFVVAILIAALPAPAADFSFARIQGPNFAVMGSQVDYHIVVSSGSTPATDTSVVNPLPPGLEYVDQSLTCYVPSGSCVYTPATRTVSWTGALGSHGAADILYSVTSTDVVNPGYFENQVTFSDPAYTTVVSTRTTVLYQDEEWPLADPPIRVSETNGDWFASESTGVAWNPVAGVFSAVWIRTDLLSSQRYLQTRTIDSGGVLGDVEQVNQVVPGEEPSYPSIACSTASGSCLVAWAETEPVQWHSGIRTRRLDASGAPVGDESILVEGGGYHRDPSVVYNPVRDEYLVVYSSQWDSSVVDVSAHRVRAGDGAHLGSAVVASSVGLERERPRAAYLAGRDQYLVAYTCEDPVGNREVRATTVAGDLAGVGSSPEIDVATGFGGDYSPGVGAVGDEYLVAWSRRYESPTATEVRARRVSGDGIALGSADGFLVNGFAELTGAVVSEVELVGDVGFVVGWTHIDTSSPTARDQHGRFVEIGSDQTIHLEFPTFVTVGWDEHGAFACRDTGQCLVAVTVTDGVDARLYRSWVVDRDGFESGGTDGWDVVVGGAL